MTRLIITIIALAGALVSHAQSALACTPSPFEYDDIVPNGETIPVGSVVYIASHASTPSVATLEGGGGLSRALAIESSLGNDHMYNAGWSSWLSAVRIPDDVTAGRYTLEVGHSYYYEPVAVQIGGQMTPSSLGDEPGFGGAAVFIDEHWRDGCDEFYADIYGGGEGEQWFFFEPSWTLPEAPEPGWVAVATVTGTSYLVGWGALSTSGETSMTGLHGAPQSATEACFTLEIRDFMGDVVFTRDEACVAAVETTPDDSGGGIGCGGDDDPNQRPVPAAAWLALGLGVVALRRRW